MLTDQEYIILYRTLVERDVFMLAKGLKPRQRELEDLARRIEERSGTLLSISTLKRLWKDDLTILPHPSTLNALVSALDHQSWMDFKKAQTPVVLTPPQHGSKPSRAKKLPFLWIGLVMVAILLSFFFIQGFKRNGEASAVREKIPFRADKSVTSGVPNTVMFSYDLSDVGADSFFIQQSWNPKNKVAIDPSRNYFSSIYYYPGFHRAKLIVDDKIVATARIHVKTDGWFPIVEQETDEDHPIYMDKKSIFRNGTMQSTASDITASGIDLTKPYSHTYYNIRDFEGVDSDNFSLETRVKVASAPNVLCSFAQITIMTEEHIFFITMTSKGCVGKLYLKLGEIYQNGSDTDLSALGSDLREWQTLRIENINKQVKLLLNNVQAHEVAYKKDFGKIVGIAIAFNSPGSVDYVRLKKPGGETAYADEFE